MKKTKKTPVILFLIFCLLVSITTLISFSSNTTQEVIIKSMTSVYDETSGVIVNKNNISFNDKNQVVKYNVVLENTQDYDVKISDIKLSTPTEEFLDYKIEGIANNDVLSANSTKELIVSFETMRIDGWGRNFADELTANISFDKLSKVEETPSVPEEDNNADDESTNDDTTSGEEDSTDKEEDKTSDKEESESNTVTKPSTGSNNKTEDDKEEVENPYTSDKKLVGILGIATCITGVAIIIVSKNKFAKYTVLIIMLSSTLTLVNAEEKIELPVKFNVGFKSQNVMKPNGCDVDLDNMTISNCVDYWQYYENIKNFNILTEKNEIEEYVYKFDVTEEQNGRVIAYVVNSEDNSVCYSQSGDEIQCYDVYLQADGIIYPNADSSVYFGGMMNLSLIKNLENFDTSDVTNMYGMFMMAGYLNPSFALDVSGFDTSKVTDMCIMFNSAGYSNANFTLDVSNFDTSNVSNMESMFYEVGYSSDKLDIVFTIKNPNTNIASIFSETAITEGSKIKVNYTNLTKGIANRMVNTKSDGANVTMGEMVETINDNELSIGDEVQIGNEYFNVMSISDDTVTLLSQYNLGTDYRQNSKRNSVKFADTNGWEYTPGPKEIDIQTWATNPKTYVNDYVEYLKEELGDDTVTGDLITLKDLETLGCTVPSDYAWGSGGWDCYASPYIGWIANGQYWWTRSANSPSSSNVWFVFTDGRLFGNIYGSNVGVRPVITISKDTLKNLS